MNLPRESVHPRLGPAVTISLIAGLWMALAGANAGYCYMTGHDWGGVGPSGDQGPGTPWLWHHRTMHGYGGAAGWSWAGLAAGMIVLLSGLLIFLKPAARRAWGAVVIAGSALGLIAGAGGFVAGMLGMFGGILAVAIKGPSPNRG